eukprot:s2585_g9.t1
MSSSWDVEKSLAARIATEGRAPKAKHAMVLKKCIMGLAEHGLCSQGPGPELLVPGSITVITLITTIITIVMVMVVMVMMVMVMVVMVMMVKVMVVMLMMIGVISIAVVTVDVDAVDDVVDEEEERGRVGCGTVMTLLSDDDNHAGS